MMMRYVGLAVLIFFLLEGSTFKDFSGTMIDASLWHFLIKSTGFSAETQTQNTQQQAIFTKLEDQKEQLENIRQEIDQLRQNLKDMPERNQNGYFRSLLGEYQDKERTLNQQISQDEQRYQGKLKSAVINKMEQTTSSMDQNQIKVMDQNARMDNFMDTNQARLRDQAVRIDEQMRQNQSGVEAINQKTNDLLESNQMKALSFSRNE